MQNWYKTKGSPPHVSLSHTHTNTKVFTESEVGETNNQVVYSNYKNLNCQKTQKCESSAMIHIFVSFWRHKAPQPRPFTSSSWLAVLVRWQYSCGASWSEWRDCWNMTHTAITQRKGEDTLNTREELFWLLDAWLYCAAVWLLCAV